MGLKEKTVSGVKWNVVSTVFCMAVQILRLSILTFLLDKSDFGLIAIAMMVISFTDIFSDLGLTVAVIHKQEITKEQYSSVYWMNIFMSIAIFSILWIISPFISIFYGEPILAYVVPLLGIQVLLNGFGKMFQTIKTKNMEFGFLSKVRMISVFVGFIATVLMAWMGLGVYSLVFGQLIQVAINQGVFALEGLGKEKVYFHFNFNEIRDFMKIGSFQLGAHVLDFISSKIDVILIGRFFSMEDLGIYNIAKDLMLKPYSIISALVSNVASSAFSKIQNNLTAIKENYKRVVKVISLICIIIYATMFVFADTITTILYAPEFASVATFLRIFVFIGIVNSINGQAGILQVALGRTDIGFKWTLVRVVCYLSVILVASYYTIYTVAYSQLFLTIIFFFVYWRLVIYPLSRIRFGEYVDIFKEAISVSLVISLPFVLLLNSFNFDLVCQIVLLFIYLILFIAYYWIFRRNFTMELIRTFLKK